MDGKGSSHPTKSTKDRRIVKDVVREYEKIIYKNKALQSRTNLEGIQFRKWPRISLKGIVDQRIKGRFDERE